MPRNKFHFCARKGVGRALEDRQALASLQKHWKVQLIRKSSKDFRSFVISHLTHIKQKTNLLTHSALAPEANERDNANEKHAHETVTVSDEQACSKNVML